MHALTSRRSSLFGAFQDIGVYLVYVVQLEPSQLGTATLLIITIILLARFVALPFFTKLIIRFPIHCHPARLVMFLKLVEAVIMPVMCFFLTRTRARDASLTGAHILVTALLTRSLSEMANVACTSSLVVGCSMRCCTYAPQRFAFAWADDDIEPLPMLIVTGVLIGLASSPTDINNHMIIGWAIDEDAMNNGNQRREGMFYSCAGVIVHFAQICVSGILGLWGLAGFDPSRCANDQPPAAYDAIGNSFMIGLPVVSTLNAFVCVAARARALPGRRTTISTIPLDRLRAEGALGVCCAPHAPPRPAGAASSASRLSWTLT